MKTLVLCRHAKSSWKFPVRDLYRPLNRRGLTQAPEMAQQRQAQPDLVLCSPAVRAWSTAVCYFQEQGWDYSLLKVEPLLIEASRSDLVAAITSVPQEINRLYLFGHNPGFNELLDWLCPTDLSHPNLVTSGRVEIALKIIHWQDLKASVGTIQSWSVPG